MFAGERIKDLDASSSPMSSRVANAQAASFSGVDDPRGYRGIALDRLDPAERYVTGIVDDSIKPRSIP